MNPLLMTNPLVLVTAIAALAGIACSRESAAPATAEAPPAPRVSGIDRSAFDTGIRPQDDLFRHVSGTWLDKTAIPADKASYGSFDILFDQSQVNLRAIVEDAARAANKAAGSDAQKVGDFYDSFMNEARAEELGLSPLQAELAAIDGVSTKADLARYFARLFKLNLITPLVGSVDPDAKEPAREILYVYQGGLGLPDRDYYLKTEEPLKTYRDKYVSFVTSLLKQSNHPSPDAAARQIFDLETRLARSHWTNVASRDAVKTYNKVALVDLPRQFPGFDWTAWTTELGVAAAPAVIIAQPSYVKAFAATVNELPVDRWKPYLRASVLNGFAPYLNKAMVDAGFGFYDQTLRGLAENRPRWKRAISTINGNLGEMLGKLYVERHFKADAKARMEELVRNLRAAFKEGIDELDWMSPATKLQAQQKLAKFRPKIGYPTRWRDYSKVEVIKDDLVGNITRARIADNEFRLAKAGKPIDPEQWDMTPQTVNAYYNPVRNEIVFPAAILQTPFFNVDADDAVNYGAIGAFIGHEMGHGFDDQGRRFDATGMLRDWWTQKDADEYVKRAKVLVEQFNAFEPLPALHVNGELTLGENIGDLTGTLIAHRAYRLSLGGKPAPTIDGLSGDRRYFMGWAQAWRAKDRDAALRQQVMTDPHSPAIYRVNGPLRHVPAFYSAFDVKEGDGMYLAAEKRTKIW